MTIYCRYESQKAVVRLAREVSNESIFALCDEIDLAIDYYKYPEIEIQLDSPGGSIDSLEYYLERHAYWKKQGVSISTLAMTEVSSAAAIILALGDIGKRRAYASSRLLFQRGMDTPHRPISFVDTEFIRDMLKELDHRIEEKIARHLLSIEALQQKPVTYPEHDIADTVKAQSFKRGLTPDALIAKLEELYGHNAPIRPEDARSLYLIDIVEA